MSLEVVFSSICVVFRRHSRGQSLVRCPGSPILYLILILETPTRDSLVDVGYCGINWKSRARLQQERERGTKNE